MSDASQVKVEVGKSGLTPRKIIRTYSPAEWEEFVSEWAEGFDIPYAQVVSLGGAGDKGRDVIGYLGDPQTDCEWDLYQCKHHDHALMPSDIYTELGKLCVFTHRKDYTVPRRYRFVAPHGVGTSLHDLLKKPEELRKALMQNWIEYCEVKKISKKENFPLTGSLKDHVDNFDFKRVWFLTPQDILNQHRRTRYWSQRFKIEPPTRPDAPAPPDDPQSHEIPYITKLLEAYSDRTKTSLKSIAELDALPDLQKHLRRSRGYFYSAEALARFSRDTMTKGVFESVKSHVYDGVVDVTLERHADGFGCVLAVTNTAAKLALPQSDLQPYIYPADKKGICHHLVNDDMITWVPK
jgi:hypothetical protein